MRLSRINDCGSLGDILHNVGEVVYDSTFCAEHQIEIAEANVEIDNDDILPRLSQRSAQSGRGRSLANAALPGCYD
jgi:hypothetical protein